MAAQSLTLLQEIALFQSADQSILIWTVENVRGLKDFRILVAYPKNDETGYITWAKAENKEEALIKHSQAIKKLAFKPKISYK